MRTVDNPIIDNVIFHDAKLLGKCSCGCGEKIWEGDEVIMWEGEMFVETACFLKFLDAKWGYADDES